MNKAIYLLLVISVGLTSCGKMDSLSSFSKRKYLKKAPKQKAVEQVYDEPVTYASTELEYSDYVLEEIPEVDYQVQEYSLGVSKQNKNSHVKYSGNPQAFVIKGKKMIDDLVVRKLAHAMDTNKSKKASEKDLGKVLLGLALLAVGILFLVLGLAIEFSGGVGVAEVLYVLAFFCVLGTAKLWNIF